MAEPTHTPPPLPPDGGTPDSHASPYARAGRAGWENLTPEQRQARIDKMQQGRRMAKQRAEGGEPTAPPKARRDRPPRARPSTSRKEDEPSDSELKNMLGEMLSAPAIPAAMILHCDYCTQHFVKESGPTAAGLVELSKSNPGFRRALIRMYRAYTALTYAGILGVYIGKPVLHHAAPDELYGAIAPVLKMPPRERDNRRNGTASSQSATSSAGATRPDSTAPAPGEPPQPGFDGA